MASQERLSVDSAAQRLGITPDAVRSRIKRGTLWAVRRNGRVQVVLRAPMTREAPGRETPGGRFAEHRIATHNTARGAGRTGLAKNEAAIQLRAEITRQKHRVRELERERGRLDRELARQRKFVALEFALRTRLQDQLDRLNEHLSDALPEILDDATDSADRLWKRLGRQVDRLGEDSESRDD